MKQLILAGAWVMALVALAAGHGWATVAAGAVAVAVPAVVYRDRRGLLLGLAAFGVLVLAGIRWQAATRPPGEASIAWWADGERRAIVGRVTERPQRRGATQRFVVAVRSVESDGGPRAAEGRVLVRTAVSLRQRKGDVVRLEGRLEEPPHLEEFDYRAYLARRGVVAVMDFPRMRVVGYEREEAPRAWFDAVHERAHDRFWAALPAPLAGLAEGIFLGGRDGIPRDVSEAFNRAGVSHLVVISGFNITLLGGFVVASTRWLLGRRRAAVLALAAIAAYSVFVGLGPPVARAALMGALAVVAGVSGRPHGAGMALLLAATALTVQEPRILQDLSFQLSFAATAGLLLLTPLPMLLGRRLLADETASEGPTWRSAALALWDTLVVTLAATAATLPLLLVNFERLSLISPVANLLLVPLFPLVLVVGAAALVVALALPDAATWALLPLEGLLALALAVARLCAALPGASVRIEGFGTGHAAAVYAVLALAALGRLPGRVRARLPEPLHIPTPLLARPLPALAIAPAVLLLLTAGGLALRRGPPLGESRVTVFELPGAPVALVTLPHGGRVLVDTGLSPGAARAALDGVLPERRPWLSAVVVTRDAPSATGGLAGVLARYRVPLLLAPPEAVADGAAWVEEARATGILVLPLRVGVTAGDSRAAVVLAPSREERGRWTVAVEHGARRIPLLTGDGDAGAVRASRRTTVYAALAGGQLRTTLAQGERATLATDGRVVRLSPPRGRAASVVWCAAPCDGGGRAGQR